MTGDASGLTHLDAAGQAHMVDVGDKPRSDRSARAAARVRMSPATAAALAAGNVPKGDALAVARVAGIMAAKRTPELIPLCHHVALAGVTVELEVDAGAGLVAITAEARASDRTGVEMEALVAVSTAALTVYDMVKSLERGVVIEHLGLLEKRGGTRGDWSSES